MLNKLVIGIIILSTSGFLLASYLTYEHHMVMKEIEHKGGCEWFFEEKNTNPDDPCAKVHASEYSKVFGIPLALLGALMFLSILTLGILTLRFNTITLFKFAIFSITFIGVVVFIYLIYLQAFVIHSFCPLCLTSAGITFSIFVLSTITLFVVPLATTQ